MVVRSNFADADDSLTMREKVVVGLTLTAAAPVALAGLAVAAIVAPFALPAYFATKSLKNRGARKSYQENPSLVMENRTAQLREKWSKDNWQFIRSQVDSVNKKAITEKVETPLNEHIGRLKKQIDYYLKLLLVYRSDIEKRVTVMSRIRDSCDTHYSECSNLFHDLQLFHVETTFQFQIPIETLSWQPGMRANMDGAFGKVYFVKQFTAEGEREVALKEFTNKDPQWMVNDFLDEEQNLRYILLYIYMYASPLRTLVRHM